MKSPAEMSDFFIIAVCTIVISNLRHCKTKVHAL